MVYIIYIIVVVATTIFCRCSRLETSKNMCDTNNVTLLETVNRFIRACSISDVVHNNNNSPHNNVHNDDKNKQQQPVDGEYPPFLQELFSRRLVQDAQQEISRWDGYQSTPLHSLSPLAKALGIAELRYKDESSRFGLGSFKALGGAYAVLQTVGSILLPLSEKEKEESRGQGSPLPPTISLAELLRTGRKDQAKKITVATATDGNHGRSVSWGASLTGCECIIYIHRHVSQCRKDAMAAFGATVVRVDGDYDESVRQCTRDAELHGWHVISDTSWQGYMDTPRFVMAGYTVLVREILEELKEQEQALPTHVFVQAGVGGLAGAISAALWQELGNTKPQIVIVETEHAPCLLESARTGNAATVPITKETLMAGLSCGRTSTIAWEILVRSASHFVTIPDRAVPAGMRLLASGQAGPKIEAGECGVPGIIALAGAIGDPELKQKLGLDEHSRVLVFGCEGATDPEIYKRIISGEIS
jgi:diaminopropionate ammonia-lyase